MAIKGILFDLYGTLIDIDTDETKNRIYRGIAHFLTYHGVYRHRQEVRDRYYRIMKEQKELSGEKYPEIDVESIWNIFLAEEGVKGDHERQKLALILAQLYRAISRNRLRLYPGVMNVLDALRPAYRMALVSDAQPCYALPEIKAVGLDGYFNPIVISGQHGFRKPDKRMFEKALAKMKLAPTEVVCVGNDMYRDVFGATRLGMKSIFFDSNQGEKSHGNTTPDYVVSRFEDVIHGLEISQG
jgi:putative hydrolase of the HAD superfamily